FLDAMLQLLLLRYRNGLLLTELLARALKLRPQLSQLPLQLQALLANVANLLLHALPAFRLLRQLILNRLDFRFDCRAVRLQFLNPRFKLRLFASRLFLLRGQFLLQRLQLGLQLSLRLLVRRELRFQQRPALANSTDLFLDPFAPLRLLRQGFG